MRAWWIAFSLAACTGSAAGPAITFDPCEPTTLAAPGATADELAGIDQALALWRAHGVSTLALADGAPLTVVFRSGAPAIYGFYDDTTATITINTELTDPAQRAVTIAHELGHALGLVHVPPATRASVMNPGNLTVVPTDGDAAALVAHWGACPAP